MLRNLISKKATILIIQVLALISLLIGQLPITALADGTPATKADVPTLIANIPPKKQQATLHDGLISSPRAQDPKYKITTNLGAFKQSPNLQAVTINLQAQGLVKAQTQWHFQISDYAVNFDQKQLQLPAGITAQKIGTGHLILTVHRDLRISKQRSLEISLPVKAVTGNYPLYFAIEYGHSPVRLKATSLGILSLGGTLAHFKPQQQMHQLAHALKQDQTPKAQAATREKERKAQPIQVHHSVATKSGAKQLIDNQQATASMKARTQTPDLRQPPYENNNNNNVFNSNINQRALKAEAGINNSGQGIKIHAENTQTHQLVGKLNDNSISMQDVTPEFEAYYDANGKNNPISKPAATVRVDNSGNGTLAVKNTGWYILHQTNNYPASSGWTYLIKNTDGTYTHDEDGNYYAVYYDANENKVTQFMSCGTRQLLPVYAPDVKALFNEMAKADYYYKDWGDALQYINQNDREVTFYGNGDLSNELKMDSGFYNDGSYHAYNPYWSTWSNSQPENQRYKYGKWLIGAMQYYNCLNHPLPQGIDTYKTPLPLSTKSQSLKNTGNGPSTSYDTTLKVNNNLVTLGDRKIQRVNIDTQGVNIDTQGRMTSSFIKNSQYNVFYAGPTGHGIAEGSFEVKLLKQADTVNSLTGKLYLSNFNQDGWYILQQKNLAGNGTSYQVNGSYYALKYSVLDGITEYFRVSQKFGDQVPLPPVVSDVKALFNEMAKADYYYKDWGDALQYINQNGGEVTFYGNGDLSNELKMDSGFYNDGSYHAYNPYWSTWSNSQPENQRYKYGKWLIGAMQYYNCLNHPLPQGIDTYKTPLPLSTIGSNGAEDMTLTKHHKSGTTQDGVITYNNDYSTNNEQNIVFRNNAARITKIAAGTSKNLAGARFKVWYSGSQGNGDPLSADQVGLNTVANAPQLETVPTGKDGNSLFNYNLEGWYIIQETQAPQGYGVNNNYYAVYLSGSGFTKLLRYSSNNTKPMAALPSNYNGSNGKTDSLMDCSYIDGDPAAITKWKQGVSTKDGFITIKFGKIIFADHFNGIKKIDLDSPDKALSGTVFNVWDSGIAGCLDTNGGLKFLGKTTATNANGQTLFNIIRNRGWYIIQEQTPPEGYNRNELYYAIYYDPANGIIGLMKHASRQLLPVYAPDVKALFNEMAKADYYYKDWGDALQYINQNGGEVTFYGNGDLSNELKMDSGFYNDGSYHAYNPYWSTWSNSQPENQRYKYGKWLIGAMQYYNCLNHPLPQGIDTYKTPLPLSTKSQEYLDLSPGTDAYTQGLTTADDFLTGKNGTLYFRDKFIGIQKVDQDNNQKTLKGATFKAFYSGEKGISNPNSNVSVSESTDKNGITKIPITNNGWYIIQEQNPPEGYSQNTSYYALKIDTTYGIIAMMTGYSSQGQPKPVYDNKSKESNYGPEVELKPGTVAYSDACTTNDGFLIAQKGHLIFQDKFIGLAKVNYYDETLPVSNAEFYLWYAGLNGDGSGKDKQLPVVDNQGLIPEDSGYKAKQNIYRTQKSGLLQLKLKKAGWYILEEGQPPTGYKNHSNFYYSFHWSPGGGVDQILKGNERQLLPPVVSDVKALFNEMAKADYYYKDWGDALQYINQNGGEVTFYGNGDLSNELKMDSGFYNDGSYHAYNPYWSTWSNSQPENQRYKYGKWLIGAMQYYNCLNHPLPQGIDTYKTPLPLSTLKHNAVKLPHTDKNDYNSPYRKGVTTNDGFLTAKNGSLYMRNIPATYLTLDNNQLVVKRSALQNGGAVWKGLWHDIDCLPTNDKKASVSLSVDGHNFEQITKPSKADKTGTDEFGQHDFQVTFKDDSSQPRPLSESKGEAGLATNNGNSLGEHDLAFQAHGTADSSVIKKKIIVVSDDYPYKVKINKDFTVNDSQQHYKKAILSDCKSRIGDQVTVYTKIKNLGNSLYNGKLTTTIPEQFMYKVPDSKCINIIADNGSTISAPIKFDGQTLTVSLPKELEKNVQYQLSYKMEQIAPMPLSYPGPSGGASAIDHLNADSRDAQYPFYGANSNLVQWFSDQALWVSLVHYPSLEFGEHLLIKDYVGMHLNNTATSQDPSQNYFKVHDTGYLGSNTWQLTAQMSQWAHNNSKKSEDNLPGSEILYQDRPTRPCFSKTISPGGPPTLLLERGSGKKFSSPDITQPLKIVQLNVGNRNPQAGKYHSTVTYTLTQSLE